NLKEDRWISAIDFQPGAGAVVHSASLFVSPNAGGPSGGKAQAKANLFVASNAGGPSGGKARAKAETTNNGLPNAEPIGQWTPGQSANRLPDDVAIKLPARSRVVMRIRYHRSGEAAAAPSTAGHHFA